MFTIIMHYLTYIFLQTISQNVQLISFDTRTEQA